MTSAGQMTLGEELSLPREGGSSGTHGLPQFFGPGAQLTATQRKHDDSK